MMQRLTLTLMLGCSVYAGCSAADENTNLYNEIKQADSVFFDAFNHCDIETIASMFSKDLEFYHDTGGLGDLDRNLAAMKDLCAKNLGLERTLLEDSLVIYPVKDFGAIQLGQHRFCHEENGKDDCGTFGFTHIWKQTESGWLLHRVVSYGH